MDGPPSKILGALAPGAPRLDVPVHDMSYWKDGEKSVTTQNVPAYTRCFTCECASAAI